MSVEYRDVSEIEIKHTCAYRTHSHLFHPFMGAVAQYHLKPNGFIVSYVCGVMMMRLMKWCEVNTMKASHQTNVLFALSLFFLVPFTVLFLLCVVSKRSFRILVYSHSNLILTNQHHAHSPNARYEKDKRTSWKQTKIMRSGRISRNRLNDFQLLSSNILNHYGDDSANKMKWKFIQ